MHQGRPYGLHVVGLPLTDKDQAFIDSVAKRVTNLKDVSGVDSMKMVYDLPDGGYVIVQDAGGNFRVIAHKPVPSEKVYSDGLAGSYVPMLYSGIITKSVVSEDEGVGLRVTEFTRKRLINYDVNKTLPSKDMSLFKFRVPYDKKFTEFISMDSRVLRTQYEKLHATWYSGAMAEVMQVVGGYGQQDVTDLPDNEFERAQVRLPPAVYAAALNEVTGFRLPGYTGQPPIDGSFQYNYKFNNTNAIGFDSERKPWLLHIGSSGVWAMPMPIIPMTSTNAFRRYIEDVGDEEVLTILDRFGAMPSGESFPMEDGAFEAWRRAGVIIKVCDTSDFYEHIAYSSACGWSLNSRGSEGYNTCYDYDDQSGIGYGLTYNLTLSLVAAEKYKGEAPAVIDTSGVIGKAVAEYLEKLLAGIGGGSDEARAILYKIRRTPISDMYARVGFDSLQNELDYWHNLELPPIAEHSGSVRRVYKGWLYHSDRFLIQPQIKFPEPALSACMSHDFLPINVNGAPVVTPPNCDTVMYAYYIGDSLKVIKYFIDWGAFKKKTSSNLETYMRAGSWEEVTSNGDTVVQGAFYSTDIDDREQITPTTITKTIVGKDLGYDTKPMFAFDFIGSQSGTLWRNRYFSHKTKVVSEYGKNLSLAVCIPFFCRNAFIFASRTYVQNTNVSESMELFAVRDPTDYKYWTYHFVFAFSERYIKNPKGSPFPVDGSPVWVEELHYNPSAANDFADSGDWLAARPLDITWLVHPISSEWNYNGGGGPPTINEYRRNEDLSSTTEGLMKISIDERDNLVNKDTPDNGYFLSSPDSYGRLFYREAGRILFGSSSYSMVSEKGIKSDVANWGYSRLIDRHKPHHFIGVINE